MEGDHMGILSAVVLLSVLAWGSTVCVGGVRVKGEELGQGGCCRGSVERVRTWGRRRGMWFKGLTWC